MTSRNTDMKTLALHMASRMKQVEHWAKKPRNPDYELLFATIIEEFEYAGIDLRPMIAVSPDPPAKRDTKMTARNITIARDVITHIPMSLSDATGEPASADGLIAISDDENVLSARIDARPEGGAWLTLIPNRYKQRKKVTTVSVGGLATIHVKVVEPTRNSHG